MDFDQNILQRHSLRIPNFDYTQAGTYLVTAVTKGREHLFGDISKGNIILSTAGGIVREEWERTAQVRPGIQLDVFVVMPDHFHGLLTILEDGGGITIRTIIHNQQGQSGVIGDGRGAAIGQRCGEKFIPHAPLPGSVGAIVGQFKSISTKRINQMRGTPGASVWQRNYHERIIRNDADYQNTVNYILSNPEHWREGKHDW